MSEVRLACASLFVSVPLVSVEVFGGAPSGLVSGASLGAGEM